MEIRYPNCYKKFHCIAGACPDTCCAGWEIPVDPRSEKRYKDALKKGRIKDKVFAKKLKKHIKDGRIISNEVTCPFLNNDGLCEMYIELGPEALCHTCTRHPRHMEDYGNLHEIVLLLSCPEVARLVLFENDGGFYVRNLPERQGNMDGIDEELLDVLLQMRNLVWKTIGDSNLALDTRMMLTVALAHDVQRRIAGKDYDGVREVVKRYERPDVAEQFVKQWTVKSEMATAVQPTDTRLTNMAQIQEASTANRFLLMSDFMENLAELDTICRDWPEMLETCRASLYHSKTSRADYAEKRRHMQDVHPEITGELQNIFEYFTYSFVLPALYDGDVLTKMKMAVLCTMAMEELYMVADRDAGEIQKINICHALARQIENSDENRSELEQSLKTETYSARRIIDALALAASK